MRANMPHLVSAALQEAHAQQRLETAWRHLSVADTEKDALLDEALAAKEAGLLFEDGGADEDDVVEEEGEIVKMAEGEGEESGDEVPVLVAEEEKMQADDPEWEAEGEKEPAVFDVLEPASSSTAAAPRRGLTHFLALRFAYGTATKADLLKPTGM